MPIDVRRVHSRKWIIFADEGPLGYVRKTTTHIRGGDVTYWRSTETANWDGPYDTRNKAVRATLREYRRAGGIL